MNLFLRCIILFSMIIAILWCTCLYKSSRALQRALHTESAQEKIEALSEGVRWRTMGNFFAEESRQKLQLLAGELSGEKKIEALTSLRSALLVSRNFIYKTQPGEGEIAAIEQELVSLGARRPDTAYPKSTIYRIGFTGQIISQLFFWSWIFTVLHFIKVCVASDGTILWARGRRHLLIGVSTFILWLAALFTPF